MTLCTATACSCSIWLGARRSQTRVVCLACTARPTTRGSSRSIARGWICSDPGSNAGRGCPTSCRQMVEQRIVAYSLGHPGQGPDRVSSELRRDKWGGLVVSPNGVWRVLKRHGLNTRTKRLALIAGYAAPYQPPRETPPQRHVHTDRPGQLVGVDCFFVGRLRGSKYPVWQITAIDCHSSYAWAMLINCPTGHPTAKQTSQLARRVARDLATCGWQLERVLTDNGNEFHGSFDQTLHTTRHPPHPHPPRQTPNQRPRRTPPQDHPGRVLAAKLRPLPPHPIRRPYPRPHRLPPHLQHRPPPPRPHHQRPHPHRYHRPRPQNATPNMTPNRRHNSERVQTSPPRRPRRVL